MAHPHPFGLTFNHERAAKLKQDAKEISSVAGIVLLLSTIGIALAILSFLTKSSLWGLI